MERTSVPCNVFLADGQRIRVRMPRSSDRARLGELVARAGAGRDDLEAERLLRYDPQRRTVLIAGIWTGSSSVIVGYAACEHGADGRPDVLIADEDLAPGLTDALCGVLATYAGTRERYAA